MTMTASMRAALAAAILIGTLGPAQAAKSQAQLEIEEYYQGVRSLYREAAKLLGAAQGYDERKPIISVQRACATSLGGLRKALDSSVGAPARAVVLVDEARSLHSVCEQRIQALRKS